MSHQPFPTTHWSLVDRMGRTDGQLALAGFLERYRAALLGFGVRYLGGDRDAAEDLVQGFIADKILHEQILARADAGRGRLRSYLIRSLKNYAANQRRAAATQTRSPRGGVLSLSDESIAPQATTDTATDRFVTEWARSVLAQGLERTRAECQKKGADGLWGLFVDRLLRPALVGQPPVPYPELIRRYGFASPAEAGNRLVTVKRMYQRHLRAVISEYATDPAQVEEELAELMAVLSRPGA